MARQIQSLNALIPDKDIIDLLHLIQKSHPSAVIAGGSLRDTFFNKSIKDYDIFLTLPWSVDINGNRSYYLPDEDYVRTLTNSHINLSNMFDLNSVELHEDSDTEYFLNRYVKQVWTVFKDVNIIQLIFLNIDPILYVEKYFDIGLCKAYCDGKKVRYTKDFFADVNNQTLTICGHQMSKKYFDHVVKNHLSRLKIKYHGFKVQVSLENLIHVDDTNRHML